MIAGEEGLAGLTLRQVAARVGMRAPSLYTHFDSKNAIYDAMFAQAWSECLVQYEELWDRLPSDGRESLKAVARSFVDFSVRDLPRHQLMNLRTIPGFEPSPEAYAPAVAVLEKTHQLFLRHGLTDEDLDLYVAVISGLIDAQHANDPGGQRWSRLVHRAIDMLADNFGLP
ncbi:MAG: TetR/AcrR family transcriptional regulator [Actinomycetales bacterium]|nr:TetR/AcrR family transcriptional regulator [Tetrasphaera sp.]NLX00090.1 TetR/AcrR family transcriptional regulator [Actinomycetales bacterium]